MAFIQSGLDSTIATVDPTLKALFVLPKGVTTITPNLNDFSTDSFQRLRVSEPNIVFEYIFANGLLTTIFESAAYGAGTLTQNTTAWTTELATTTASGTGYWCQAYNHIRYAPGMSSLFQITFNFNALATGLIMRVGMFTDQGTFPSTSGDGIFLEANGSTVSAVVRSYVTGSGVETRIAQASWNMDKLDGTGASGITLNWTYAQHLIIEFQWLGVGVVRIGFETGSQEIIWAHQFLMANMQAVAYTRTGSFPVRAECYSTGSLGQAGKLSLICTSVFQEGLIANRGWRYFSGNSGTTLKTIGTPVGLYPITGLRALTTNDITKRTAIIPVKATFCVAVAATTSTAMQWALLIVPTPMTGASYGVSAGAGSSVGLDQAVTSSTLVTGVTIASGVLPIAAGLYTVDFLEQVDNAIRAGQNQAGNLGITGQNCYCLAYGPLVTASGSAAQVAASITWKELT